MRNDSRQWLIKLLEAGSLPVSGIPKAAKAEIGNFVNAGFIKWEKSGAGARYIIVDEDIIGVLIESTGYHGDLSELSPKAKAVALHGDAHKGHDDNMLLIMSTAGPSEWSEGENTLDLADQVSRYGIGSILVKPGDQWHTSQPVGLVENLDLLIYARQYFDKLGFQGSLIYYSGWLSRAFLDWLTEMNRAPSYVLFADYDIVGIKNYLLAKNRVGNSLTMYIPDNINELLMRFGKTLDTKSDRKLIEASGDPVAIDLYHTLLETKRVLHQESLLLI
ncbi:MAG: hypothetical protein OEM02_13855 [Desulfobulbaceae bacterium]|nr:hypothetical protein [Desulfobulbaceae bacterium]